MSDAAETLYRRARAYADAEHELLLAMGTTAEPLRRRARDFRRALLEVAALAYAAAVDTTTTG